MLIDNNISHMLTISEVASMLHVHPNTLRQWTNQGIIKTYRISQRGDRRFAREDVISFLEKLNTQF
jgi:excisionase family DNA binding protein